VILPKQNVAFLEAGYFLRRLKLTPVLQFTRRDVVGIDNGDETRRSIGANYWWAGHNANVKAAFGRISPLGRATQDEFTLQLQLFYF
jgi:hypothetical protein